MLVINNTTLQSVTLGTREKCAAKSSIILESSFTSFVERFESFKNRSHTSQFI